MLLKETELFNVEFDVIRENLVRPSAPKADHLRGVVELEFGGHK